MICDDLISNIHIISNRPKNSLAFIYSKLEADACFHVTGASHAVKGKNITVKVHNDQKEEYSLKSPHSLW